MSRKQFAVFAGLALIAVGRAHAYQANCSATPLGGSSPFQSTQIFSQFGEPRGTSCSVSCTPNRFHAGIDIGNNCIDGHKVFPIEGGRVSITSLAVPSIPTCNTGSLKCVRVTNTATGRAFDYVHVDWTGFLSDGDIVTTATQIGVIQPAAVDGNHLHLNEKLPGSPTLVNPEFVGRLDFRDTEQPDFVTPSQSPTAGSESVVLVDRDGGSYPTPFVYRSGVFYVRGKADIFATARNGNDRKGLYRVGTSAYPIVQTAAIPSPPTAAAGNNTQVFGLLQDAASLASEVQTIYWKRQSDADTFNVTRKFNGPDTPQALNQWWDTTLISDGVKSICVYAQNLPQPTYTVAQECVNAYIDNTNPTFTMTNAGGTVPDQGATSTTTITVNASDPGGIYSIGLSGPSHSSTTYLSGVQTAPSIAFPIGGGTLSDGSYTATVVDLAGNSTSDEFRVQTGLPACGSLQDIVRSDLFSVITSTQAPIVLSTGNLAGVCSISLQDPNGQTIGSSGFEGSLSAITGPFPNLSTGIYTTSVTDCAGNVCLSTFSVVLGTGTLGLCLSGGGGNCANMEIPSTPSTATIGIELWSLNTCFYDGQDDSQCSRMASQMSATCNPGGWGPWFLKASTTTNYYYVNPGPCGFSQFVSTSFMIYSSTDAPANFGITAELSISTGTGILYAPLISTAPLNTWSVIYGSITVPGFGNTDVVASSDSAMRLASYFSGVSIALRSLTLDDRLAFLRHTLGQIGDAYTAQGSDFVFTSTTMITLTTAIPSGLAVDTTTISMYQFDGTSWSSSTISNQFVSVSSLGVVTATGAVAKSGTYSLLYQATDSSAPITTLLLVGATFTFDQALFVATDTWVVFTATDPLVNGYASTVASITYRMDPSSGSPFYIYSSSIPLPLGTHVFEYRTLDYAGNTESIKTATFTVTAGTALRTTNTAQVPGVLLNGFLGSGAKLEVESQAQNSLTLLISSANRQGLVSVDNIGEVGIGVTPQANLNIGANSIGLQLRSGNSTSAVTSNQIALGYNGDYSMRHLLRTEHSTAAHGNKLDFLVWNTGAGSTTTLASLSVLSLHGIASAGGGSFHVQPVGEPDAEVEVSNGLSTGGGTMQRLQVVSPSSRRFKTDIKDLSVKDEERALEDVAALKHARFRYKSRGKDGRLAEDPARTLHTGLIYEEAPESIREGGEALSTSERLVNVELALKAEMRRLEELQKRYEKLKARRKTP